MDLNSFKELVREIQGQGYDPVTAARYASLIGDVPVTDQAGNVLVYDGAVVVATLKLLRMFERE